MDYNKYFLPIYRRKEIDIFENKGTRLVTNKGEFLDLISGLGVNVLGGSHPKIIEAIKEQAEKFLHVSNFYATKPVRELAEYLTKVTFASKVFFSNSGTESMEAGLKLIKKYGNLNNKRNIIVFKNAFHGRSLGSLSLTPGKKVHQDLNPLLPNIIALDYNDYDDLEKYIDENCSGVILEVVQGHGGVNIADKKFVQTIRNKTKEHQAIMFIDEIQSGIGRTGKFLAYEHFEVVPDLCAIAKAVGGGLPLGALLVSKEYDDIFGYGEHGSTFGGNPLSCAAGLALLKVVNDEKFLDEVREKSSYFESKLLKLKEKYPKIISRVNVLGFMIGVEMKEYSKIITKEFEQEKIIVNVTNGNILRLLPPLILTKEEIDLVIATFDKILARLG